VLPAKVKSHHLPGRVHATIGAAGAQHRLTAPANLGQRCFQLALHRSSGGLALKAI
jgi:hypothetical protein